MQKKWEMTEVARGTLRPVPQSPEGLPESAAGLPKGADAINEFNARMSSHWSQVSTADSEIRLHCMALLVQGIGSAPSDSVQSSESRWHAPRPLHGLRCEIPVHCLNCVQISLVPCMGCGRTFRPEALEHHVHGCKGSVSGSPTQRASVTLQAAIPGKPQSPRTALAPARHTATAKTGTTQPSSLVCYLCG